MLKWQEKRVRFARQYMKEINALNVRARNQQNPGKAG